MTTLSPCKFPLRGMCLKRDPHSLVKKNKYPIYPELADFIEINILNRFYEVKFCRMGLVDRIWFSEFSYCEVSIQWIRFQKILFMKFDYVTLTLDFFSKRVISQTGSIMPREVNRIPFRMRTSVFDWKILHEKYLTKNNANHQGPDFDDMSSFSPCEIEMQYNILILDVEHRLQK